MTFGATYFNQQVQNLITTAFVPVYTSVNIGSAHVQGVETEFSLRPTTWLSLNANYTYTDTNGIGQAASTGSRLLRRPAHAGSASLTLKPVPELKIVPQLAYTGVFRDFLTDNAGFGTGVGTSPQGLIASLAISYDVTPALQVYVNVRNVFHSKFEAVNGYQTPGPSGWLGVRVKL